jgi:lysophospholipase L1-like esterase
MKTVLCYGDSNTWGAAPMANLTDDNRLPYRQRWLSVMEACLGSDWRVIAEGLPGRTTVLDDPVGGNDLSGLRHLPVSLKSHQPFEILILMLGTNDLKSRLSLDAEDIASGIGLLIQTVRTAHSSNKSPVVLVVCPPPIIETGVLSSRYAGGASKSLNWAKPMEAAAAAANAAFVDAGSIISVSPIDGIHFDVPAHKTLGEHLADFIIRNLSV